MTMEELVNFERIVKSSERVRDLGEVFTPNSTVREMLDLLPKKVWIPHPSTTFLEPACGDGNFLIEILDRKLTVISQAFKKQQLPAGDSVEAAQFHGLQAIASIYAVDISSENIIGGTVGHEIGARSRLLNFFVEWNQHALSKRVTDLNLVTRSAKWIIEHNLIVGNMLAVDSNGKSTRRNQIPLIEYEWSTSNLSVSLFKTNLGDVISAGEAESGEMLNLFSPDKPESVWKGKAMNISDAERFVAPALKGIVRNGTGKRL